ncbi:MAG: LLM class F420-dependent oxidoreductase, partial [Pseudonocardiales bacterium]
ANHWLPSGPRSTVERALEQWEDAIGQFIGG